MAGRNMAAGLGMNIDWRLKDPGMFNRGIENFSRPDADPTNLEQMQGLMNWQQQMGREDAARTTLTQMEKLKAEQKQSAQARMQTSIAQRQAAIEKLLDADIPQEQRQAALDGIENSMRVDAAAAGLDPTKMVGLADKAMDQRKQRQLTDFQLESQEARQIASAKDKATEQAIGQLLQSGVMPGSKKWEAAKKNPIFADNSDYVMAYEREFELLQNSREQRAERQARNQVGAQPIDLAYTKNMVSEGSKLPDGPEKAQLIELHAEIEKFNAEDPETTLGAVRNSQRAQLMRRLETAENRAARIVGSVKAAEASNANYLRGRRDSLNDKIAVGHAPAAAVEARASQIKQSISGLGGVLDRLNGKDMLDAKGLKLFKAQYPQNTKVQALKGDVSVYEAARVIEDDLYTAPLRQQLATLGAESYTDAIRRFIDQGTGE